MSERFQELWTRLSRAALVAGAAFVGAAGYVYYLTIVAFPDRIEQRFGSASREQILEVDMAMIGLVVVMSALVGSFFAQRYRLRGLGTLHEVDRGRSSSGSARRSASSRTWSTGWRSWRSCPATTRTSWSGRSRWLPRVFSSTRSSHGTA